MEVVTGNRGTKGTYSYKEVNSILKSVSITKTGDPNKVKTGDMFLSSSTNKVRPHMVLSVRKDVVLAAAMTSTNNEYALLHIPDRFKKDQFISAHVGVFPKEFAVHNYIRSYDGSTSIKEIKAIIKNKIRL